MSPQQATLTIQDFSGASLVAGEWIFTIEGLAEICGRSEVFLFEFNRTRGTVAASDGWTASTSKVLQRALAELGDGAAAALGAILSSLVDVNECERICSESI